MTAGSCFDLKNPKLRTRAQFPQPQPLATGVAVATAVDPQPPQLVVLGTEMVCATILQTVTGTCSSTVYGNRKQLPFEFWFRRCELHDLCWQFEEAWQNGMKPRVQDWLGKAQLVQRGILLEELLQTETELRHLSDQDSHQFISEEDTLRQVDPSETKPTELKWTDDGRYQFINEIARGGAGAVWRVFDHRLDHYSAIKLLLDSQDNVEMRGRLEQEARISARLQHPGIVPVHELSHLGDGCQHLNDHRIDNT